MVSVQEMYAELIKYLINYGLTVTTMESCTSGLIASLITDTEGSSAIFKGSYVTYCNEAKVKCGVPAGVIEEYGVYSEETSLAMAKACRESFGADIGIGVTGTFANADPSNNDSVPGEVFVSVIKEDERMSERMNIPLDISRHEAKLLVAKMAAEMLMQE